MLVIVNVNANSGNGLERWRAIEAALPSQAPEHRVATTESADEAARAMDEALAEGERHFVAAGGDGTVNAVLNHLMLASTDDPKLRQELILGGVGLGSSNDFQKPFAERTQVAGTPIRWEADNALASDVGRAELETERGEDLIRYFVLNASLGAVAASNAFFNTDERVLVWLKKRNVELAILYTALVNLIRFRSVRASLKLDGRPTRVLPLANLGILKKVQFAGGMRYDTQVTASDGKLDVAIWHARGRWAIIRTMISLYRGRFLGLDGTEVHRARRVEVEPFEPAPLELDGEVQQIRRVSVEVLPRALRICE